MSFFKSISAALVTASVTVGAGQAQSLRQAQIPAEYPPAAYKGMQYIDSRGCVYIRAGIDGATTWVPRVSRERKPVCGQTPTQVDGASSSAPFGAGVEQITLDASTPSPTPSPAAATPAPKPAPKPAARVAAPAAQATIRAAPKPAAAVVTETPAPPPQVQPQIQVQPRAVANASAPRCTGASPLSTQYINRGRDNFTVRCGPQLVPHVPPVPQAPGASDGAGSASQSRVLPAHVANERRGDPAFTVPEGYRPVWDDDRLNARRAEGTLTGWRNMQLVWSNTLPRRLVDAATGRDVTAEIPLVYPFTDTATQKQHLGTVTLGTMGGKVVKRVQRNPGAPTAASRAAQAKPVIATRAAPAAAPKGESLVGKRYVQVATFGVPANAQATAQRLKRTGLPVRIGKLTRGGKTYRLVLAGPFADSASAQSALRVAQQAGFSDAYIRN